MSHLAREGYEMKIRRLPGQSIFALVFVALTCLFLAACGGGSSDSNDDDGGTSNSSATVSALPECSADNIQSPPDPNVEGTVRVLVEEVTDWDVVADLIPEFNKEYPNVKIEVQGGNYDVIREQQIASFQRSEGSQDLVQVDTAWIPEYAEAGFLEDLGPAIACMEEEGYDYEDFAKSFREIGQADGKVYGVPFYSYPTGFVYDTTVWKETPETLDELVEMAKANSKPNKPGLALQPKSGQVIIEEWNAYLLAAGGQMRDEDGNWQIDTPEGKKALETYIQVYNEVAPKNSLNWSFDETVRAASSGEVSALSSYGWVVPIINQSSKTEFGLAPFPGGRGTGGAWQWAIPTNSQAKDAAWAFISWLTSKEQDKKRTIAGGAPVRNSVMDDPEVWEKGVSEEYYTTFKEVAAEAVPICRGVGCAEATELIGQSLNAAVSGSMSVEEALAKAQQDAEAATG
jgi:multiple sugar transport system substrate-binding protein